MKNQQGLHRVYSAFFLIVALALVVGGVYFFNTKNKQTPQSETPTAKVPASHFDDGKGNTSAPVSTTTNAALVSTTITTNPKEIFILGTNIIIDSSTLHIIDKGYGNVGYAKDKNHVYYLRTDYRGRTFTLFPDRNVDVTTFELLPGDHNDYTKDKNHIYKNGEQTKFDSKTFALYSDGYMKDVTSVYYDGEKIEADTATFTVLKEAQWFAKDKDHVYFMGKGVIMNPRELPSPDAKSFVILDSAYAKDSSHVYYIERYDVERGIKVVSPADAETFYSLGSYISDKDATNYAFAKDKSHAYYFGEVIPGVDSETFEFVGQADIQDPESIGRTGDIVTKDKQCIYLNNERVLGSDGLCINTTLCTIETINTSCGVSAETLCSSRSAGTERDQCIKWVNEN